MYLVEMQIEKQAQEELLIVTKYLYISNNIIELNGC